MRDLTYAKQLIQTVREGLRVEREGVVVLSHLHYDHAGGAFLFPKSELVVQHDEYANALHPPSF